MSHNVIFIGPYSLQLWKKKFLSEQLQRFSWGIAHCIVGNRDKEIGTWAMSKLIQGFCWGGRKIIFKESKTGTMTNILDKIINKKAKDQPSPTQPPPHPPFPPLAEPWVSSCWLHFLDDVRAHVHGPWRRCFWMNECSLPSPLLVLRRVYKSGSSGRPAEFHETLRCKSERAGWERQSPAPFIKLRANLGLIWQKTGGEEVMKWIKLEIESFFKKCASLSFDEKWRRVRWRAIRWVYLFHAGVY